MDTNSPTPPTNDAASASRTPGGELSRLLHLKVQHVSDALDDVRAAMYLASIVASTYRAGDPVSDAEKASCSAMRDCCMLIEEAAKVARLQVDILRQQLLPS